MGPIIPNIILPIGNDDRRYFLVGPHYGNKKYRLMVIRKSNPMDEIFAIEDAHILDALDIAIKEKLC